MLTMGAHHKKLFLLETISNSKCDDFLQLKVNLHTWPNPACKKAEYVSFADLQYWKESTIAR